MPLKQDLFSFPFSLHGCIFIVGKSPFPQIWNYYCVCLILSQCTNLCNKNVMDWVTRKRSDCGFLGSPSWGTALLFGSLQVCKFSPFQPLDDKVCISLSAVKLLWLHWGLRHTSAPAVETWSVWIICVNKLLLSLQNLLKPCPFLTRGRWHPQHPYCLIFASSIETDDNLKFIH